MRILEVRDSFLKIETQSEFAVSSFIKINDIEKQYVAQIIQIKGNIALAKILFLYDNGLANYDNSSPSIDSQIEEFTSQIIKETFETKDSIIAGQFIQGKFNIPLKKECLKKTLISIDSKAENNTLIKNLAKQFDKTLIIDTLGIIEGEKYTAGVDFKLPLNTEALEFMYEDCLNDATVDSKNLIKEIFTDLSDYSKTVPFLPFGTLKSIVDDMVDKSHIFKLLVLKNKLAKFDKLGYFAATAKEAANLGKILESKNAVIDLSKLDSTFQNRYLDVIYSMVEDAQVFVTVSNNLNKKSLKKIFTSSIFMTHSKFKYLNEIKSMFDNFIIEPTFTNKEIFKIYSTFLNSMDENSYLLVGEGTNYIPFVCSNEEFGVNEEVGVNIEVGIDNDSTLTTELVEEVKEEEEEPVESIFTDDEGVNDEGVNEEVNEEVNKEEEEFHTEVTESPEIIEVPADIDIAAIEEEAEAAELIEEPEELEEIEDVIETPETPEAEIAEVPDVIPLDEENDDSEFDEIVELDESEFSEEDDIIVELEEEEEEDSLDKEIVEDVDKVFTTIKEDTISDSDLDFIDELNEEASNESTFEELSEELIEEEEEDGFLEPLEEVSDANLLEEDEEEDSGEILETKNTSTPIVPVYDADIPQEDLVTSDPIEQGDSVVHAKYGTGTVEKMIKYGNKTLYSINFDNVGRRLLDPTLTEIKKG